MTEIEIIDGVIEREGGYRNVAGDRGGPTNWGITAQTLGAWRKLGRHATAAEVKSMTRAEAEKIYAEQYVRAPGFIAANIAYEPLRLQLIDFGVNSGPERAIRWLQRVLDMPEAEVDGVLGPKTLQKLSRFPGRLVNDALVAARSYMIDASEDAGLIRPQDEEGVESRALKFFLAKPPATK